jgi:hypothetical protein
MWILPKQLISAFAQDTEALTSDSVELSQTCAQSLMRRSKPSPAKTYLREWKAGSLMRLRSGAISRPSLGQSFLGWWIFSLAATHASPSVRQDSEKEQTTQDTSGLLSQVAFKWYDPDCASSRTWKDTLALDSEKSLQTWKALVTKRRGEYSARLNAVRLTSESACLSWPSPVASEVRQGFQDRSRGMKGSQESLTTVVLKDGLAAPVNPNTHGSRLESWPTPASSTGSGGPHGLDGGAGARSMLPEDMQRSSGKLNPRWVETLMGLPVGWTMPSCLQPIASPASVAMMSSAGNAEDTTQTVHALGQIAVTTDNRTDELRLLGNGVVPATAALAFQTLLNGLRTRYPSPESR